jgi:FkbM family methyltransferase
MVCSKYGTAVKFDLRNDADLGTVAEVFWDNCYDEANVNGNDVWLDIGANIGCFAFRIFDVVERVYCFEPEADNFNHMKHNIKKNNANNIKPFNYAVVGNDDKIRELYLHDVNTWHSFVNKSERKVEVNCVNINYLINSLNVNKIKIDVEGGEYEIITGVKDFSKIKELIMEWHYYLLSESKLNEVIGILRNNYKTVFVRRINDNVGVILAR